MKRLYSRSPASELAGTRKASFKMPFGGAEIWFEHLDGMYQYANEAIAKLERDSASFLRPSFPSLIAFNFDETRADAALLERAAQYLTSPRKRFTRAAFVGLGFANRLRLRRLLKNSGLSFAFINDFEKAKQWLAREQSDSA